MELICCIQCDLGQPHLQGLVAPTVEGVGWLWHEREDPGDEVGVGFAEKGAMFIECIQGLRNISPMCIQSLSSIAP